MLSTKISKLNKSYGEKNTNKRIAGIVKDRGPKSFRLGWSMNWRFYIHCHNTTEQMYKGQLPRYKWNGEKKRVKRVERNRRGSSREPKSWKGNEKERKKKNGLGLACDWLVFRNRVNVWPSPRSNISLTVFSSCTKHSPGWFSFLNKHEWSPSDKRDIFNN